MSVKNYFKIVKKYIGKTNESSIHNNNNNNNNNNNIFTKIFYLFVTG